MLLCSVLMLCACFDIVLYLDALVFFPVASMIMYQCSCVFSCYSHALSCSHVLSCCSCHLSCFCALCLMLLCFFPTPTFCLNIPVLCPTFIFCLDAPMLFPTPVLCPHALSCPVPVLSLSLTLSCSHALSLPLGGNQQEGQMELLARKPHCMQTVEQGPQGIAVLGCRLINLPWCIGMRQS